MIFFPKYISGYPIGQFSIKVYINGKVYFGFFLAQIKLVSFPDFAVFSGFHKMANSKKSRDNVPHDFFICFSSGVEVFKTVIRKFCAGRAWSMAQNFRSGTHFL